MGSYAHGPWISGVLATSENGAEAWVVRQARSDVLDMLSDSEPDICICRDKDTARLLSAAPDLLEALRDMVSDHADINAATLNHARAALIRATGEV